MVQGVAMEAWEQGGDFEGAARADADISSRLDASELDACFDLDRTLSRVPTIYERVFPHRSGTSDD